MLTRRLALPAVVLLLALTACSTPAPAETPTPSLTLSDQALAYSAAEANWNEYVETIGEVDLADQASIDRFLDTMSGELRESAKKNYLQFAADGWTTSGEYRSLSFEPTDWSSEGMVVIARACLDVTDVDFRDAAGESQVSESRSDIQNLGVAFKISPETWTAKMTHMVTNTDGSKC